MTKLTKGGVRVPIITIPFSHYHKIFIRWLQIIWPTDKEPSADVVSNPARYKENKRGSWIEEILVKNLNIRGLKWSELTFLVTFSQHILFFSVARTWSIRLRSSQWPFLLFSSASSRVVVNLCSSLFHTNSLSTQRQQLTLHTGVLRVISFPLGNFYGSCRWRGECYLCFSIPKCHQVFSP